MTHSKPICLCGFMGVGKTSLGKKFSEREGLKFIDLDEAIEKAEQKSIAQIFKTDGEEKFREREFQELQKVLGEYDVIALGGGTLLEPKALKLIQDQAILIFLKRPLANLPTELENRPLLNPTDQEHLYQERLPGYLKAALTLDLEELDPNQIHDKLVQIRSS